MNPAKQDFILEKHVFKMVEIETASACEVNCFMEADCVSYNLKPQQNGKLLCELSDSDHANNQQDLRYREGTVYRSFKVSWIRYVFVDKTVIYFKCTNRKKPKQNKMKEICKFFFIFHVVWWRKPYVQTFFPGFFPAFAHVWTDRLIRASWNVLIN